MRIVTCALVVAATFLFPCAQAQPQSASSPEIAGRVVDEAGAPVAGAVVVARWNWLTYRSALEGSGYYFVGDAIHVAEALTDRDGRYAIPGWGPKARASGRLEQGAPAINVFKTGYEPSSGRALQVRLLTARGPPGEYAKRVIAFQEQALAWQYTGEDWRSMPRMIDALFRENERLDVENAPIYGVHVMPGRSGVGRLLDARTGDIVSSAVVAVTWTLKRRDGAPGSRRFVQTKHARTDQPGISFYVAPSRLPAPSVPGWEIDQRVQPDVSVYVPGYHVETVRPWPKEGADVRMRRKPEGRDALLEDLREWRRDIDREVTGAPDRAAALDGQKALLAVFVDRCRALTPDLQKGLCYEPDSEMGQFAQRSRMNPSYTVETFLGARVVRVVALPAPAPQSAAAMPPGFFVFQRVPVSGFSIEPAK